MRTLQMDLPNDTKIPWTAHLLVMDEEIARNNAGPAVRAWRAAYAAALESAGWQGIVDVAEACLRIGAIQGFRKACESKARETYWTALFRARQQGSLDGVLRAAEAFGILGDRAMLEECIRIAERIAAQHSDAQAGDRVRALASQLAERYLGSRQPS